MFSSMVLNSEISQFCGPCKIEKYENKDHLMLINLQTSMIENGNRRYSVPGKFRHIAYFSILHFGHCYKYL